MLLRDLKLQCASYSIQGHYGQRVDYKGNKVLGSWQSNMSGNGRDGLIASLDNNLLSRVFAYKEEMPVGKRFPATRHYTAPGF